MKSIIGLFVCLFTIVAALFLLSCSNSTGPSGKYSFPAPIDSVATDITLYVYSDIYGAFSGKAAKMYEEFAPVVRLILDTLEMDLEGSITIDIEEDEPATDPPRYFIYAEADGFYTELYYCEKGGTITVDLDAVPEKANSLTGVLFEVPANAADQYFAHGKVVITGAGDFSTSMNTDSQGRFGFGNLPAGEYSIIPDYFDLSASFLVQNTAGTDYGDFIFYEPTIDRAPYIYLYPEAEMDISVRLDFPQGGEIIESEPPYVDGWNVCVRPDGTIDNEHEYLFYESRQAVPLDYSAGWVLDGNNLENEFRDLLSNLGFIENEIDDFIQFWMPKFGNSAWYAVYPQDANSLVSLKIIPPPDNILRALFLIKPLKYKIAIPAPPAPETFIREGFVVTEWGVIGWPE